jgi:hypothetical protein
MLVKAQGSGTGCGMLVKAQGSGTGCGMLATDGIPKPIATENRVARHNN